MIRFRTAPPAGSGRLVPSGLAAGGLAFLLLGVLLGFHHPGGALPRDLGIVPAAAPVVGSVTGSGPDLSGTARRPATSRGNDLGSLARMGGRVSLPPSPPVAVRLPGGPRAHVTPIRVGAGGVLAPPARVSEVGWWQGGAAPGQPTGSIVLAGHVDAADQGVGVFARLWHVRLGQSVRIGTADGRQLSYRITARRSYPRSRPLPASLFAGDVANRLVLITCAGRFNASTAHYSDSLAVFAVPA